MEPLILVVEDEVKLARVLSDYLKQAGFATELCHDGRDAWNWLASHQANLVLLDLMLPGIDGLELCREIRRKASTPIIMTTARVEEIDRLLGLELGADDYICKPYSPREVVARVKAVLRRSGPRQTGEADDHRDLHIHGNRVYFGDHDCELSAIEMRLLQALKEQPGRVFSRDQLMDAIYPDRRLVSDRTIDSHVKNLRRKLDRLAGDREFVRSVYGAGYKYE